MDGAQDRLPCLGEFLEKVQDDPGGLRVEARCRLVHEQQKRRLCRELDANSEALALFDVEPFAGHADDGIGIVLHIEQLDNLVHVGELLLARHMAWLTEQGAEA